MSTAPGGASVVTTAKDPLKKMWMETNWANLSRQGQRLGLAKIPYYDPETMLLSKDVNHKLWRQLGRLYNMLGPNKAPYAAPVMLEGGEIEWRSYLDDTKGDKVDVYEDD